MHPSPEILRRDLLTSGGAGLVGFGAGVVADLGEAQTDKGAALVPYADTGRTVADKLADVLSVKDFGAVGDGVADDTTAIQAAVTAWRAIVLTGKHQDLYFPAGRYRCGQPLNLSGLGTVSSTIYGAASVIDFFSVGGKPALVDLTDTKELSLRDIFIFHAGNLDDLEASMPKVGILMARKANTAFSGRFKFHNVKISGAFWIACLYNNGTEENVFWRLTVGNAARDKRAMVITSGNDLGMTSEFQTLMAGNISTTHNTFFQPSFTTAGADVPEAVRLQGTGSVVMISPYSSCGGVAHYALIASGQAIFSTALTNYQAEQDRVVPGDVNADHVVRLDGNLDHVGLTLHEQLSTTATTTAVKIDGSRFIKRADISVARRVVVDAAASPQLRGCTIKADGGVDLTTAAQIAGTDIYADAIATVTVPAAKNARVRTLDHPQELTIGKTRTEATAATITIQEQVTLLSGNGTVNTLNGWSTVAGAIVQEAYLRKANPGNTITLRHGVGNIYTRSGTDYVIGAEDIVEVRHYAPTNSCFIVD